ncbi:mechanosensitive ion channel [Synechococcus sp. BSF8S]|nr:mechanosensitive ion channel [Synechococcus sp. BSF8S]MBC1263244.1 mechanosensitive ion channel [Synechococcus sp. BSA11S]
MTPESIRSPRRIPAMPLRSRLRRGMMQWIPLLLGLLLAVGSCIGFGPSLAAPGLNGRPSGVSSGASEPQVVSPSPSPPSDFATLIDVGSFVLAPVRILGVPVIQVTSRTVGAGSESIDARRRARVIEGNLMLLYQPVQVCSLGERLADGLIRRWIKAERSDLCSLKGWKQNEPDSLVLRARSLPSGLAVIEALLPGRRTPFTLLTVTEADAQFFGTTPWELAESWRSVLQARLRYARAVTSPSALLSRLGLTAVMILIVVLAEAGIIWLWQRVRSRTVRLHRQARENPCTTSLLLVQVNFGLSRLLLVLVVIGLVLILSLLVMAVPGQIPLGLELLVVPAEAAAKVIVIGGLAIVLRSLASFLLFQWSANLAVPAEEQCRREQRFRSLLKGSHRLINCFCLALVGLWILFGIPGVRSFSAEVLLVGGALLGALALGFQSVLRDFLAGIVVALEDHYAIGDWVEIDGDEGVVEDVGMLNTTVRCLDQRLLVAANSSFQRVINHTKLRSGVEVTWVVAPNTASIERVLAVAHRVIMDFSADPEWKSLLMQPPLLRGVTQVSPLGITISALLVTRTMEQWRAERELLRRLVQGLQQEQIRLAYIPELKALQKP